MTYDGRGDERTRQPDDPRPSTLERARGQCQRSPPGLGEEAIPDLRILIANEEPERLEVLAQIVTGLGHDVVARETNIGAMGSSAPNRAPDVALVSIGLSSEHALDLIEMIVQRASYPVIALLSAENPDYVREAAKRGVFAYIVDTTPEELQGALDITLSRFTEYHKLQGAFGRRAVIEQAKGILMGRHAIDADTAFEILRDHSQHSGLRLADVAAALVQSHALLSAPAARRPRTHPGPRGGRPT